VLPLSAARKNEEILKAQPLKSLKRNSQKSVLKKFNKCGFEFIRSSTIFVEEQRHIRVRSQLRTEVPKIKVLI